MLRLRCTVFDFVVGTTTTTTTTTKQQQNKRHTENKMNHWQLHMSCRPIRMLWVSFTTQDVSRIEFRHFFEKKENRLKLHASLTIGVGFKPFLFMFTPYKLEMIQFDFRIFFRMGRILTTEVCIGCFFLVVGKAWRFGSFVWVFLIER